MAGPSRQIRDGWTPNEPFDLAIHPKNDFSLGRAVRHGTATVGEEPDIEAVIGHNDAEGSTWNQPLARLPPQLKDSSAITALSRLSGKGLGDESLGPALQQLLGASGAVPQELYDLLLVWLYNHGPAQRLLALCHKADDGRATVLLLIETRSSVLSPPSWLVAVLRHGAGCPSGRWINEVSLTWVDTTWRTAFSVLHVGGVSPLAMMPRIEPFRIKALWTLQRLQTRAVESATELSAPADDATRTRPTQKRATSGTPQTDESRANKKQRQRARKVGGAGSGRNSDKSSPERNGPRRAGRQRVKAAGPKELPFACHFYKRFPLKHLRCLFHHQKAPRYVKTHLDRCHRLPIHCPVCWETFDSQDECDDHDPDNCVSRGPSPFTDADGITKDQAERLENLSPGDGAAKWYEMWNVLFPDDPEPDSPYIDSDDTENIVAASVHDDRESTYRASLEELQRQGGLSATQVDEVMRLFTQTLTSRQSASMASSYLREPIDPRLQPPIQEADFFTPTSDLHDTQFHSSVPQHLQHQQHGAEGGVSDSTFPFSSQQQLGLTVAYHEPAQYQSHRQQQSHVAHNQFLYQQADHHAQGDPSTIVPQLHQQHQHDAYRSGQTMFQYPNHHRPILVSQAATPTSRRSKPPSQGGNTPADTYQTAPVADITSPSSAMPPAGFGHPHEDPWAQLEDYLRMTLQAEAGPLQAFSRDEYDRPRIFYPPGGQQQQQQQQHPRRPGATHPHQRGVHEGTALPEDVIYHTSSGLPYDSSAPGVPSVYPTFG
ncbi:hypothetical protein CMUS01_11522 [Colletotrichum musicola]|uniref:C2H2-type domain-containing protein n=1 Tax=Colletotrichum musicola TaxID=2175873 RepID=A0A8H6N5X4_9PEZI|nr:hypothetical protein CMUS01_11522 [Colletotrichum musicola]